MAEQRMKVRDKKVQKMTKDGLVEENLTDKSSVRVSNRASDVQRDEYFSHSVQTGGKTYPQGLILFPPVFFPSAHHWHGY